MLRLAKRIGSPEDRAYQTEIEDRLLEHLDIAFQPDEDTWVDPPDEWL